VSPGDLVPPRKPAGAVDSSAPDKPVIRPPLARSGWCAGSPPPTKAGIVTCRTVGPPTTELRLASVAATPFSGRDVTVSDDGSRGPTVPTPRRGIGPHTARLPMVLSYPPAPVRGWAIAHVAVPKSPLGHCVRTLAQNVSGVMGCYCFSAASAADQHLCCQLTLALARQLRAFCGLTQSALMRCCREGLCRGPGYRCVGEVLMHGVVGVGNVPAVHRRPEPRLLARHPPLPTPAAGC
jgi:hypothetical protein